MKILIVEDEIIIAEYIKDILEEENFKDSEMAHNTNEAIEKIEEFKPDLILLDINLNGKNDGIELAKMKNENAVVIYLTSQYDDKLMSAAIKTNPESYLTKPIKKQDLIAAINLAHTRQLNEKFVFKDGYETIHLNFSEILYFKADGNYVDIYTKIQKFVIRDSLKSIEQKIPYSQSFKRVHKSFIVNTNFISKISSKHLLIDKTKIPIGRVYANSLK